ncbi:PAS domain S-box-containing protein/diguanylate cyclase (GGDEF) domain-containing protein [Atopomonas hussainii]|uniref:cyclic-guanylate-specific phosphodiesterase n=1 Tax=Atopomonas hussainii TaxID=1429083 RepID=A0A1H7HKK9_9GAMM|nr:EAL domain-containing protein [Atopomonas hussainii]SEK50834.1 PAS domain S-box-containing protein/diguanylate cyclase (GGDEF) domain-containing protein [Atopomonas hussainii]
MEKPANAPHSAGLDNAQALPHLAQLGLLRYVRRNDASWQMLSVDEACSAILGLNAEQLCCSEHSYARCLYACNREQLHAEVQQQLSKRGFFRLHYYLQTPGGLHRVCETGQRQAADHDTLRGYLWLEPAPEEARQLQTLQTDNERLRSSLELYRKAQDSHLEHLARSRAQQDLLLAITKHAYHTASPLLEAGQMITRAACEVFNVNRIGAWRLQGSLLIPIALYQRDEGCFAKVDTLDIQLFPRYLKALQSGRSIDAHNAQQDPRTSELTLNYLKPLNISSMLDAAIRAEGQVVGVLCLERQGETRHWQADEIAFAAALADQLSQALLLEERQQASSTLNLFRRALEQSASAVILVDRLGRIEYTNSRFSDITQYEPEQLNGQLLSEQEFLAPLAALLRQPHQTFGADHRWQGEFKSYRKDLAPYWAQLSLSRVLSEHGELTHYLGIFEDITQSKLDQQRIERLAYVDDLTGLGNRAYFLQELDDFFGSRDAHGEREACLMLIDVDNFKRINDSLGHQTGDKLLMALAKRLGNSVRQMGKLARLAGNEFAVLLEDCDLSAAHSVADEALDTLSKPLFFDNQLINLTVSLGLACAKQHAEDPPTLLKHAGLALHKAKSSGKNRACAFDESLIAEASYRLFLENNLHRALELGELEVHYQPKIHLGHGKLQGLEALLRWRHPEKGMIRPDQFISVAEETGLILPIGKWVIREACQMLKRLGSHGLDQVKIAINLSPKQFSEPDLAGAIAKILQEENIDGTRIELELTESLLMDASQPLLDVLESLKSLGLSLAMDDFGTGYSSLSYLKKFPIDVLKIDRSFVMDIPQQEEDMEITAAVIAMAHNLRLNVVAEGIETREQLQFLRLHKCDIGQGYLFDKPLPPDELIERLKRYQR